MPESVRSRAHDSLSPGGTSAEITRRLSRSSMLVPFQRYRWIETGAYETSDGGAEGIELVPPANVITVTRFEPIGLFPAQHCEE